jgi:hypothetical protein
MLRLEVADDVTAKRRRSSPLLRHPSLPFEVKTGLRSSGSSCISILGRLLSEGRFGRADTEAEPNAGDLRLASMGFRQRQL